jgi:hypothetical protein
MLREVRKDIGKTLRKRVGGSGMTLQDDSLEVCMMPPGRADLTATGSGRERAGSPSRQSAVP